MTPAPTLLQDAVRREIGTERILWSGVPEPWGYGRSRWPQALMGIPFTAFSVFWTWGASGGFAKAGDKAPPLFFPLWGLMFVVFGLSMLLSPLFAAWKAGRVYYVVTERRAVIFEKAPLLKIQSFDCSSFGGFERISRGGRGGDVIFQRNVVRSGKGSRLTQIGFLGLRSVAEAEQSLRKMMAAAGQRA